MTCSLLCVLFVAASPVLSPEPHETRQLMEQYEQNAERCDDITCSDEELDGLDSDLLMLLGRRAAVLRQRNRIIAQAKHKGRKIAPIESAARLAWLTQKATELGVPKTLSEPVLESLVRAAERYERQPGARSPQ